MRLLIAGILFFGAALLSPSMAQSAPTPKTDTAKVDVAKKTTLDTEESLKYMGNQLLFQMKKRLNLTTKEEEKKQSNSSRNKKFSFFGIEIERD